MSKAELQLRPFALTDAPSVARWLRGPGLGLPPGRAATRWAARLLADPKVRASVAWAGGERVGFARLDIGPDRFAELTIAVAGPHRRQGIGGALLRGILAQAKDLGLRRVYAIVARGNAPALQFFREQGFEEQAAESGEARFVHWVHGVGREVLYLGDG